MTAVYAIVNANQKGWTSLQTLGLLGVALAIFAVFLLIEVRVNSPLVPLALFKLRNLATADAVGVLWAGAMFAWFFLTALYMQLVLGYSPLEVGLGFLPGTIVWGLSSIALSDRMVMRFGIKLPVVAGLLVFVLGLVLFARAPADGNFWIDVLPGMLLFGLGGGITFNPLLLAAMGDVKPTEAGLASGIVNTAFMMGGALGLAVLASLAASRTDTLRQSGEGALVALNGGYHAAFLAGAVFAVVGLAGALLLRPVASSEEAPVGAERAHETA
jgi:MFS family permease